MVLVTFVLSCDLFWGFSMDLEPQWFRSIEFIIECVKNSFLTTLNSKNLDVLYDEAKRKKFHIHDHSMDTLCALEQNSVVYICDH